MKRSITAVALACALSASIAHAQSPEKLEEAKALFNAGAQAYSLGQYIPAIQAFEEAYKITPRAAILFSLAQAERRQYAVDKDPKRLERAVDGFRKYIAEVTQGGRRADAVAALGELEPLLEKEKAKGMPPPTAAPVVTKQAARLMVTSPTTGAKITLDGKSGGDAPYIGEITPGPHTVIVSATGHDPETRNIKVFEGGVVALDLPLKEKPAFLSIDAPSGAEVTVDGRLVGVAPITTALALTHGRHFVAVMKNGALAYTRDVDLVRGETTKLAPEFVTSTQRKVAYGMLAVGGVSLVTGGVFTVLTLDREKKARNVLDARDAGNVEGSRLDDYDRYRLERDRFRTWSMVTFGAAGALVVTGGLLYFLDRPTTPPMREPMTPEKTPAPKPAPMEMAAVPLVSPTLLGASFSLSF